MRLDKIDLNLFVVFEALYRERSVTRVAAQLNLTQPAVSNNLSRLRETLDDALFVRSPEGMAPTPVADNIIVDVRKALELMRQSVGPDARFDPGRSEKTFRLGMNDLAEYLILPRLRGLVQAEAPHIAITSCYLARETATADLKSGQIDLLLDAPAINARELHQTALTTFPYVATMRKGHPLRRGKLSVERYIASEHLHVSSRRKGRGHVDIALNKMGKQRRIAMRVQNYLAAAKIVQETDLVWTVPRVLAGALSMKYRELPFDVEPLSWNLYWSRGAEEDPANRWMRQKLSTIAEQVMPQA